MITGSTDSLIEGLETLRKVKLSLAEDASVAEAALLKGAAEGLWLAIRAVLAWEAEKPAVFADDDRLSLLAESLHTGWRKGTDGPYALAIHRLIRETDPRDWGAYVKWVDWCLREVGYTPELPEDKEQ